MENYGGGNTEAVIGEGKGRSGKGRRPGQPGKGSVKRISWWRKGGLRGASP